MWDGEPPTPVERFQESFEGGFTVETGRVVLGAVAASPHDRVVELPAGEGYHLRAYRSRSLVRPEDPEDAETSVQRWLLQVW